MGSMGDSIGESTAVTAAQAAVLRSSLSEGEKAEEVKVAKEVKDVKNLRIIIGLLHLSAKR